MVTELNEEKAVDRIIIAYEDGTTREIEQGMALWSEDYKDDHADVKAVLTHMKGKDLIMLIYAMVELGSRLGLFNREEREEEC